MYVCVYVCMYTLKEPKIQTQVMTKSPVVSSQVQIKSKDEAPVIKNNLAEPEYDFLSKQPTEIVDETYKVNKFKCRKNFTNIKSRKRKFFNHRSLSQSYSIRGFEN